MTHHQAGFRSRGLALILLALVLSDLGDADCDPIGIAPASPGFDRAEDRPADRCGAVCVPDCFCCSVMLPAQAVFVLARARLVSETPDPPSLTPAAGHTPLLDHVPILSARLG